MQCSRGEKRGDGYPEGGGEEGVAVDGGGSCLFWGGRDVEDVVLGEEEGRGGEERGLVGEVEAEVEEGVGAGARDEQFALGVVKIC